jgi:NADPH:quinone reductase-like Zn-dependent oxidoreductase
MCSARIPQAKSSKPAIAPCCSNPATASPSSQPPLVKSAALALKAMKPIASTANASGSIGGYAEYIALSARYAVKLPDEISFAEGTVITRHFPMAFNLVAGKADVRPGEWVLVMGATGALGSSCLQVAKMLGANVIAGAGNGRTSRARKKLRRQFWNKLSRA